MARVGVEELKRYQWFVLRVRTGKERTVEECLKRAGYAVFNPTKRTTRYANGWAKRQRRKTSIDAPIFNGYMFLGMNEHTPTWLRLFTMVFVYSVVGHEGAPLPVAPRALADLVNRHNGGEFDAPEHHRDMATGREFDIGDTVITDDGLIEAKVEELQVGQDGTTAVLHVGIFGRDTKLTIDASRLYKAA